MYQLKTTVQTGSAKQYLYKLCKHFARKIRVEFNEVEGQAFFPPGDCRMLASPTALTLIASSDSAAGAQQVCQILEQHLQLMRKADSACLQWEAITT